MAAGWNKGIPHKKETKQKISQTMRSNHRMHSWTEEELRQWSDDLRQQWQQQRKATAIKAQISAPEGLRNCAKSITDNMQGLTLTYDGVNVPNQEIHQKYRVGTSPFSVNFPPKNVFNANPPGPSTTVSDGYWVMFEPPSVGDHDIKFAGCSGNPSVVETGKFCQNVNYHLKVGD